MQGITALQSMNRVRPEWLAEADAVYLSIVNEGGADSKPTAKKPRRERQVNSGWVTAAVCAGVGLCVYLAILLIGRNVGHGQPVGTVPGDTFMTAAEHTAWTVEQQTVPETAAPETTVPDPETVTITVSVATDAATEAKTEPFIPTEPEEQRVVREALAYLRQMIDNAVYATQEMYIVRPQADGTEISTAQIWAKDTRDADNRIFRFSRIEPGYAASGTDNAVTLIGDQLYFAKATGVNGRQSKKRNTLTEAQQSALRAAVDALRMPLPTSDFGDLLWVTDAAMGHRYIYVTAREVDGALIDRLLTAAGYDTKAQTVTVSDVGCEMYFEVADETNPQLYEEVLPGSGLHTRIRLTASEDGQAVEWIFDIMEFGSSGQEPRITAPENWYSGYSTETDSATLLENVLSLLTPRSGYTEQAMYVTAAALKIRSTPDFGGDDNVIGYLTKGEAVTVVGETDTYYIIRIDGFDAYVGKSYLSPDRP